MTDLDRSKSAEIQKKNDDLDTAEKKLEKVTQQFEDIVETKGAEIDELQDQLDTINQDLENANSRINVLENENELLAQAGAEKDNEIHDLKDDLHMAKGKIKTLESSNANLSTKIEKKIAELSNYKYEITRSIEDLKTQINQKDGDITALREEVFGNKNAYEMELKDNKEEIDELRLSLHSERYPRRSIT